MVPRKVHTRSSPKEWLIGDATPEICGGARLPTRRQVLQHLLFCHEPPAVPLRQACALVIDALLVLWERAGIPTVSKKAAVDLLSRNHKEWTELKKNKKGPTTARREKFILSLDKLFDIGVLNVEKDKSVAESSLAFYKSMQENREMYFSDVLKKCIKKGVELRAKRKKRVALEWKKRNRAQKTKKELVEDEVCLESCDSEKDASSESQDAGNVHLKK